VITATFLDKKKPGGHPPYSGKVDPYPCPQLRLEMQVGVDIVKEKGGQT